MKIFPPDPFKLLTEYKFPFSNFNLYNRVQ